MNSNVRGSGEEEEEDVKKSSDILSEFCNFCKTFPVPSFCLFRHFLLRSVKTACEINWPSIVDNVK